MRQVRIVYDLYQGKLSIGFIDEPTIKWDIELRVGLVHLPDWLEDSLPSWLIGKSTPPRRPPARATPPAPHAPKHGNLTRQRTGSSANP